MYKQIFKKRDLLGNREFSGLVDCMSTIGLMNKVCAVCGKESEYSVLNSTNTFGSPDLDLRPPEMRRSTMHIWIQECPFCGYISKDVTDETSVTKELLSSERYLNCDGHDFKSDLSRQFYKNYMINMEDGNLEDAFSAIHCAAWACDDAQDLANAKLCRTLAIFLLDRLIKKHAFDTKEEDYIIIKADLLRRSGCFERLFSEFSSFSSNDNLFNKIIHFQLDKASQGDTGGYKIEDAVK